jgi:hypothetical protein
MQATLIVLDQPDDAAAAAHSGWVGGGPVSPPQHQQGNGMQHAPATPAHNGHKAALQSGGAEPPGLAVPIATFTALFWTLAASLSCCCTGHNEQCWFALVIVCCT